MKKKIAPKLLAIISGVFAFIAIGEINFFVGCICLIPLFTSTFRLNAKQGFKQGFIFGLSFSCFAYMWMVNGAERFTGYNALYGAGVFLVCAIVTGLYWACLIWCSSVTKISNSKYSILFNSLNTAALFCVFEFLWSKLTTGMPWFNFYTGNACMGNVYAVQPTSFFGIYALSFFVVVINYLFAVFIENKQWKKLWMPAAVILLYLFSGYLIFKNFSSKANQNKQVTIAVIAENILPDIKWDDANGNMLVQRLLDLNKAAVAQKPDIILWSESAIPWTYKKDDDLVNEILKESSPANATHILGINTQVENNVVNNSAYCILPNGNVTGRYDKQFLLSFIEKPLSGFSVPFFSNKGFLVKEDETHSSPLQTKYGKAGIMICNESVMPDAARQAVKNGAGFLCNMSNDGWFNNTYIVNFHFLNARLRAVETRKDVVVNCNNGYSGVISASGNIIKQEKDTEPFVQINEVHPNNIETLNFIYPYTFIFLCLIVIIIALFKNYNLRYSSVSKT